MILLTGATGTVGSALLRRLTAEPEPVRCVVPVVHLAAAIRDQPRASIEELNAVATLRLVRAAERAGAQRFVFFSAMGARHHSRTRFFRAKALAQEAVQESALETMVFQPSIVYAPGDPW